MINFTRFLIKNPGLFAHGIKGYLSQPLTPRLLQIMMQYLAVRSPAIKLVPWAKKGCFTAGFPLEFARSFDVFPYHPEAYAACTGAADCTIPPIEFAESLGISRDLCSYMKTSIGASRMKYPEDFGGFDTPDFWAAANAVCDTHIKWFENEARISGTPFFGLDVPSYVAGEGEKRLEEYIDYIELQLYDLIKFLEDITRKKFNEEKFLTVIKKSAEACRLYMQAYEYRKRFPANDYFEWQRLFMLPVVVQWNIDDCLRFYRSHLKKAQKRYGERKVIDPGREKYRVLWEGITIWYKVDLYTKVLAEKGAKIVCEPYTYSFALRKKSGLPLKETLRQIGRELLIVPYTLNLDERIKYFDKLIDEYSLDGIILFANQSCRPSSTGMQVLRDALYEKRGIPILMLNTDHCDPRAYADGPINTRIDGFIEMMEAYKKRIRK